MLYKRHYKSGYTFTYVCFFFSLPFIYIILYSGYIFTYVCFFFSLPSSFFFFFFFFYI
ncbi:hypothetical protein PFBG_00598 [Plasmodium falciparum 7G8]|uniref:Uncharacterized protein n=1 Tax=Plasmodium falciparum (isolate 7G8) TaxID=57266 RepID=W7FLB6_PLAF8|nr:hypothetical protein PFBG_00598 [Plasmodium falciparum 7G8]